MKFPKWAEKYFSLLCTEHDAVCTKPDEDINGWDYLVEFPQEKFAGPVESSPSHKTAFIQIKSSSIGKLTVQIKLSNMLKAARSKDPWFIILIVGEAKTKRKSAYVIHVWDDLIYETLEAVRKAGLDGVSLNKRSLTIKFLPESKVDDELVPFIVEELKLHGNTYAESKTIIMDSVGYENGYGIGKLSFTAQSERNIEDIFLGSGDGEVLESANFSFTPQRFGLPDIKPEIVEKKGKVIITPHPVGKCSFRIRGANDEPSIKIPGEVFAFNLPGRPIENGALRFSAPPIEIIHRLEANPEIKLDVDYHKQFDFSFLKNFGDILFWLSKDKIDIEIWHEGNLSLAGKFEVKNPRRDEFAHLLKSIFDCLQRVMNQQAQTSIKLSIEDLMCHPDIKIFKNACSNYSLKAEFPEEEISSEKLTALFYYSKISIRGYFIASIMKRFVIEDIIRDGIRYVTFSSNPIILESYFFEEPTLEQMAMIDGDYESIKEQMGDEENVLCFGDIIVFLKNLAIINS